MPILPLPQFEADLAEYLREKEDREAYARLRPPKTMVVRFGAVAMIGEFPYTGDAKPGCGSKVVVRTHRGTELAEMLTSTCPNSGCSKSVSRREMLEYVENSGGKQYPFYQEGRVLRIATAEDLDAQARIEQSKHGLKMEAREIAERLGLAVKIVDAEPILGGERITYYYMADERADLRGLQEVLAAKHAGTRVDLRAVGARDEARLTADYEKCGQHCCCKSFLKVLKPINMRSAKVQKQTLDPLKISGRCGRLMCCLRYEDETYEELRRRLPRRGKRVGTPHGDGEVLDGQILTQLVLVRLDGERGERVAVPVEELSEPGVRRAKPEAAETPGPGERRARRRATGPRREPEAAFPETAPGVPAAPAADDPGAGEEAGAGRKRRRRRRRSETGGSAGRPAGGGEAGAPGDARAGGSDAEPPAAETGGPAAGAGEGEAGKRRRRRRRRRGGEAG